MAFRLNLLAGRSRSKLAGRALRQKAQDIPLGEASAVSQGFGELIAADGRIADEYMAQAVRVDSLGHAGQKKIAAQIARDLDLPKDQG